MAKRKRRAFTREFKAEAVRLVRESGKSVPNARARTSGRTSARGPRDHAHHDAVRRRDRIHGPESCQPLAQSTLDTKVTIAAVIPQVAPMLATLVAMNYASAIVA